MLEKLYTVYAFILEEPDREPYHGAGSDYSMILIMNKF
jgi:hypothetical protein